ncbi:MAG: hypothetical protein HOM74_03500 [Proteobacteria bacterium]|nr:hypothetical protein [Pseudomonadota bacterium]
MEKQNKILIIDDDVLIGSALRRLLHVLDADITVTLLSRHQKPLLIAC